MGKGREEGGKGRYERERRREMGNYIFTDSLEPFLEVSRHFTFDGVQNVSLGDLSMEST